MCGFAGIAHFDPRQPVDVDRLRRMRDVLSHRGPDGAGLFIDGAVGLAHRRLAIVDVSSAGEQPMTNEDGSVWIAFNGEIYNHASTAAGPRGEGAPLSHRGATPKRSSICTKRTATRAWRSCTGCSPSRSGTRRSRSCCSRAIGWASSRSTTPARAASSCSGRKSSRSSPRAAFGRPSTKKCCPSISRRASCREPTRSSTACGSCCRVTCSPGRRRRGFAHAATGSCPPLRAMCATFRSRRRRKTFARASKRRSKAT